MPGSAPSYDDIDLVIVRENTEDLYAGVEYDLGIRPRPLRSSRWPAARSAPTAAISIKPISVTGVRRIIVKAAFEYAVENKPQKVTAVCKANIMKYTDGLFYKIAREVAAAYGAKFRLRNACRRSARPDSGRLRRESGGDRLR